MSSGCLHIREYYILYTIYYILIYISIIYLIDVLISTLDLGLLESKDCCFVHLHIFGAQDSNRHGEPLICMCWRHTSIREQTFTSPAITLSVTHLFSSLNVAGKPRISSTGQGLARDLKKKQCPAEHRHKLYYLVTSFSTLEYISTFFCFVS